MYITMYSTMYSVQYNVHEAGRIAFLKEEASSANHLDACVQQNVYYSLQYSEPYSEKVYFKFQFT